MTALINEAGGLRLQRIPPTERKGRVHSSTVTVAVINPNDVKLTTAINESDINVEWYSGTGKGGQNRNKVQACCRLTHIPTGIMKTAQCRTRATSYAEAYPALEEAVRQRQQSTLDSKVSIDRKNQVGSGMRGDKRATIRFQDDTAIDHRTGKKTTATRFMKGFMDDLWN